MVFPNKVEKVLITIWGGDPSRKTDEAIRDIKISKIDILIGTLFCNSYKNELENYESDSIKFIKNTNSYFTLLTSADLILSSVGTFL